MNKPFPIAVSAHDLLKAFAVVIMIIDHIGYYFYPDDPWWRAVGRIGFPIWFFLVGHASGRDLSPRLVGGAIFLTAMNAVVGLYILPLNALVTIICLRLVIDRVMGPVVRKPQLQWVLLFISVVLVIPSNALMEYGTLALVFAMAGYMVRHREEIGYSKGQVQNFMLAIAAFFLMFQYISFAFTSPQFILMGIGTLAVCMVLCEFKSATYPALTEKLPRIATGFLQMCGRHTLEIYIIHLTLFKIAALLLGYPKFELFNFHIF